MRGRRESSRMTMAAGGVLLVLLLTQGLSEAQQILADHKVLPVNPGESAKFVCKTRGREPLLICTFSINGIDYNLSPKNLKSGGVSYSGQGLDQGECGVEIDRVEEKHNGDMTCTAWVEGQTMSIKDVMKLIVTVTPKKPQLEVHVGDQSGTSNYKERDQLLATCTVRDGRPVANISWYLEDELILDGLRMPEEQCLSTGVCTIQQNLTRTLQASDNKKKLRCIVDHLALKGNQLIAEHQIYVNYPPKRMSQPIERFGLVEGMQGRVPVTIEANPKPTIQWKVGSEFINEGESRGRYTVLPTEHSSPGQYDTVLLINSLTKDDINYEYTVSAKNDYGLEHYSVTISTSPEPKVLEIGAGMIIVIVVAIIIIILILAGVLFARAKGKFCFAVANAEKRVTPPSEGTENPAVNHHASSEYINNSPELKKEKPKEDTPV